MSERAEGAAAIENGKPVADRIGMSYVMCDGYTPIPCSRS